MSIIPTEILTAVSASTDGVQNEITKNLKAFDQSASSEIGLVVSTLAKIESSIKSAINDVTASLSQVNDPQLTSVFEKLNTTFQRFITEIHGVFEGLIAQAKNDQATVQDKIYSKMASGLEKVNSGTQVVAKWVTENISKIDLTKLPGCMRSFAPKVNSFPSNFGNLLSSCLRRVGMQNKAQITIIDRDLGRNANAALQAVVSSIDKCLKSVGINNFAAVVTLQVDDKVVLEDCLRATSQDSLNKIKSFIPVINNIRSIAAATQSSAQNCFR